MTDRAASIALGTVQFGLDYGVSNPDGRTTAEEVAKILCAADDYGIRFLDTAAAYGESEAVLGQVMDTGADFSIITKTPVLDHSADLREQVHRSFQRSLARLRQRSVYGLLAHRCDDLLADDGDRFYSALCELKENGSVANIGASIYSPDQAEALLQLYKIDIVQLPLSILDQRMLKSGVIEHLAAEGVEVHVRSCFLQGVILMAPADLPPHLQPLAPKLTRFQCAMTEAGMTPLAGALAFARHCPGVRAVVVGVCSKTQLDEIAAAAIARFPAAVPIDVIAEDDTALIDPRNWAVL